MKMHSMATTAEMKKMDSPTEVGSSKDSGPKYPYGTKVTLENGHVGMMGMDDAAPGDDVEFTAKGKVMGARHEDMGNGKKRKSVDIQITHMGMMGKEKKSSPRALGIGPKAASRMAGM